MQSIINFLNTISFGPSHGDWSGALVAIVFGLLGTAITLLSGIFLYFRWIKDAKANRREQERLRKTEEEQNYLRLRERYDQLWDKIIIRGIRPLKVQYNDNKKLKDIFDGDLIEIEKLRTTAWQLINHLSDIEFLYCHKQDSLYWKRWDNIFKHIFSLTFIKMAFNKNKDDFKVNSSFVKYVDKIISADNKVSEELTLAEKLKEATNE